MLSPSKKFNKIQLPVSQFAGSELYTQAVGGGGGPPPQDAGFQVTGKIKWGKN